MRRTGMHQCLAGDASTDFAKNNAIDYYKKIIYPKVKSLILDYIKQNNIEYPKKELDIWCEYTSTQSLYRNVAFGNGLRIVTRDSEFTKS